MEIAGSKIKQLPPPWNSRAVKGAMPEIARPLPAEATTVVYVALLLVTGGCAGEETVETDDSVEELGSAMGPLEAVGAELVKESRVGAKASPRSRFPAAVVGYNRYYPGYSPEYYYPPEYRSYYPGYPSNYIPVPTINYPPVAYPTNNYPPVNYPINNYPPVNYPTNYYPAGYPPSNSYEYAPYVPGVNEYSARHERA